MKESNTKDNNRLLSFTYLKKKKSKNKENFR